MAQSVKNPPAMRETWVRFLGQEDPLEEGMTTHSSILAWRIPWTEEPGGLQSTGSQSVRHDLSDSAYNTQRKVLVNRGNSVCGGWAESFMGTLYFLLNFLLT